MPQIPGNRLLLSLAGIGSIMAFAVSCMRILLHIPRLRLLPALHFLFQLRSLPDYVLVLFLATLSPFLRLKINSCLLADKLKSS